MPTLRRRSNPLSLRNVAAGPYARQILKRDFEDSGRERPLRPTRPLTQPTRKHGPPQQRVSEDAVRSAGALADTPQRRAPASRSRRSWAAFWSPLLFRYRQPRQDRRGVGLPARRLLRVTPALAGSGLSRPIPPRSLTGRPGSKPSPAPVCRSKANRIHDSRGRSSGG